MPSLQLRSVPGHYEYTPGTLEWALREAMSGHAHDHMSVDNKL